MAKVLDFTTRSHSDQTVGNTNNALQDFLSDVRKLSESEARVRALMKQVPDFAKQVSSPEWKKTAAFLQELEDASSRARNLAGQMENSRDTLVAPFKGLQD